MFSLGCTYLHPLCPLATPMHCIKLFWLQHSLWSPNRSSQTGSIIAATSATATGQCVAVTDRYVQCGKPARDQLQVNYQLWVLLRPRLILGIVADEIDANTAHSHRNRATDNCIVYNINWTSAAGLFWWTKHSPSSSSSSSPECMAYWSYMKQYKILFTGSL